MKVQVWRSGGLLGRRVEWDVVVDEQPDAERWYVLIARLPWHEHPVENTMPDRYTYEIRCEPHEAVIPEQQLVGPWRELVDRVREANHTPASGSNHHDEDPEQIEASDNFGEAARSDDDRSL